LDVHSTGGGGHPQREKVPARAAEAIAAGRGGRAGGHLPPVAPHHNFQAMVRLDSKGGIR